MAKKIEGLQIQFGADTTGLGKALKSIDSDLKTTQGSLNSVNKALKFDHKNTELLAQKQKYLSEQIQNTEKKLNAYNSALKEAEKQVANGELGEEEFDRLKREIVFTTQKLEKYKSELNSISTSEVDKVSKAFKLTKSDVEKLNTALKTATKSVADISKGIAGVTTKALTDLTKVTAALGTAFLSTSAISKEFIQDMSKLEQNANKSGYGVDKATNMVSGLNALTGELDSSIEAVSNIMATGFNTSQAEQAINALSGAVIQFPDTLKIESLADSLQETIKTGSATGQFSELIERTGTNLDDFNNKLASATTEADRQRVALEFLANSGLSDINAQYQENNKTLIENEKAMFNLQQSLSDIGQSAMPLTTILADFGTKVLNNLSPNLELLSKGFQEMGNGSEQGANKVKTSINNMISEASGFIQNNLTTFMTSGVSIMGSIVTGLLNEIPQLIPVAFETINQLVNGLSDNIPLLLGQAQNIIDTLKQGIQNNSSNLIDSALDIIMSLVTFTLDNLPLILEVSLQILLELINGITENLPVLIPTLLDTVIFIVEELIKQGPLLVDAGFELITALANALIEYLPVLIEKLPTIIESLVNTLISFSFKLVETGLKLIASLGIGLIQAIPQLLLNIPTIMDSMWEGFVNGIGSFSDIGKKIVEKIGEGAVAMRSWLWNKITGIFNGIGDFFGFGKSTSRVVDDISRMAVDNQRALETLNANDYISNLRINTGFNSSLELGINSLRTIMALANRPNKIYLNNRELSRTLKDMGVVFR